MKENSFKDQKDEKKIDLKPNYDKKQQSPLQPNNPAQKDTAKQQDWKKPSFNPSENKDTKKR